MAKVVKHKGNMGNIDEFSTYLPASETTGIEEFSEGRRPSTPFPSGGRISSMSEPRYKSYGGVGPFQERRISRQEEDEIYERESFEAMMSEAPGQGGISQMGDALMSKRFDVPPENKRVPKPSKKREKKDK